MIAKYDLPGGIRISQGSPVRQRNDEAVRRGSTYKGMMQLEDTLSLVLPTGSF